jgi:hypothetical protein
VAQGVSPEFKLQHQKNQIKKKKHKVVITADGSLNMCRRLWTNAEKPKWARVGDHAL